jgi:hypothetical protein
MNALAQELDRTRIRDLGEAEFARRYACERFTATVLANRFEYVIDHMCERLLACAFSPILRDAYDFAATLAGPPEADYPTPVVSKSLILFTGTMTDSVRNTIVEYGLERVEPGDVIVANDPYRTGTHVNDLMFIRPVFHGGRIVAFVNIKAHQLDMGGAVPGGFSATKTSTYENGLVLSPRALYRAGKPVRETWTLIFDNVRFGDLLKPDMHTICGALELGERLMLSTIERYGAAQVVGAMSYVCDADAECMTRAIEQLPDGVHRLRRHRRERGVSHLREDHQAPVAHRSGRQRHLAAGAHMHQCNGARHQDHSRRCAQVPARSARPIHVRHVSSHRHGHSGRHDSERAAARRRRIRVRRADTGADGGHHERDGGRARAERHCRRDGNPEHPQCTGTSCEWNAVGLGGYVRWRARPLGRDEGGRRR